MKVLAAMAALAITLGLNGVAEIWELPVDDPTLAWVQVTTVPLPTIEERACVTIPIYTDADGFLSAPYSERSFTGGLNANDIRASLVGHFLNIAFDQSGVNSWDMILSSIDVTGLDKVTICE